MAYIRWARADEESDASLAARAGLSAPWMAKWKVREDAPPGRREGPALARALDCSEAWLLDGAGAPPFPELWRWWIDRQDAASPAPEVRPRLDDRAESVRTFIERQEREEKTKGRPTGGRKRKGA